MTDSLVIKNFLRKIITVPPKVSGSFCTIMTLLFKSCVFKRPLLCRAWEHLIGSLSFYDSD